MNALVLPFAVLCSLGLAGLGLSFLAFYQTTSLGRAAERRTRERHSLLEAALDTANEAVNRLATEVRDLQQQPRAEVAPAPLPRPALNISTRSQALRMHRRGDSPAQIASVLNVPLQEIDLLLKVHRIVLQNLVVAARPIVSGSRGAAA
jgi:plasmid stabilization system protein ParE